MKKPLPILPGIQAYNDAQSPGDKAICNALARALTAGLPGAENKI